MTDDNGGRLSGHAAQVIVMSYDYTVLAGTHGADRHRTDRDPARQRCLSVGVIGNNRSHLAGAVDSAVRITP